jgi:hypothetical protein
MRTWLFVLLLGGCGPSPFQRAADGFQAVAHPAADALAVEHDPSGDLCRDEQRFSFLRGAIDENWHGAPSTVDSAYLARREEGVPDGKCEQTGHEREIWVHTLSLIAIYGDALRSLADSGVCDATTLAGAASSLGALANSAKAPGLVGGALGKAGDPLKAIADFALGKHIESELRAELGRHRFEPILDLADEFLRLSSEKRLELQTTVHGATTLLARRPGDHAAFVDLAARWYRRLEARARRDQIYQQIAHDVRAAYAELVAISVGDKAKSDDARASAIAGYAHDVAEQATILHNLIAIGE